MINLSIHKIGILESAKNNKIEHTGLGKIVMYYFSCFVKNKKAKSQETRNKETIMDKTIFIKCDKHSKVNQDKVLLKDVAEVYCAETTFANKAKAVTITHLKKAGSRKVVSVLYVMEQIQKAMPGVIVQSIGETDFIIEWEKKPKLELIKIVVVSLIAFFGTAFTIMAFHNDIGIRSVFEEVYYITKGTAPDGVGILEIAYCLGLFLGITVFFNHFGKKKFTADPTPVAVAMHNYEADVNQAIVENAQRRGGEESE